MNDNKDNTTEKITQIISLIAESIAIVGLFITLLLFISRFITCLYYGLPTVYNSLSLLKSIPTGLYIVFGCYCGVVSSVFLLDDYNNNMEENDDKDGNNTFKMTGAFWISALVFAHKSFSRIISKANKAETKNRKKRVINAIKKCSKRVVEKSTPRSTFIRLPSLIIILIGLDIIWMDIYQILAQHEMRIMIILCEAAVFLFLVYVGFIYESYVIHFLKKISNLSQQRSKSTEIERSDTNEEIPQKSIDLKIKYKTIVVGALIILYISAVAVTSFVFSLTSKHKYGVVEMVDNHSAQQFAIVLDLDDYYILEPVNENNSNLVIDTEKYMYIDKNSVMVTQKRYLNTIVIR